MNGGAYVLVVIGILLAKGLGFYRDMVFAGTFGTGIESDIYFQVFGLVNLIFTGVGVALSTLVIKNLNKPENAGNETGYAASFLRKSILWLTACAVLMALFAKPVVHIILPNLSPDYTGFAVRMMYMMCPSLIFVVVAYIISGLLQNKRVFFITSIMSLPFNVALIAALMVPNVSMTTVGAVTTLGWFLHIVILLPAFYKKDYRFFAKDSHAAKKGGVSAEIIWIFLSNMMFQLCVYIDRAFVTDIEGMASTFNYASNLFITISSVFVVAMSTVVFPAISKNYEEKQLDYVSELIRYIITIMVAIFLPFVLVVAFFGTDVIRLVYERGEFTATDTACVSAAFLLYSLGVLGYIAQELFNKVLYLAGKYRYTVLGTLSVIALNLGLNLFIYRTVPASPTASGLAQNAALSAGCTALLMTLYAVLVALGMKKVLGHYFTAALAKDIARLLVAGALAALVYFICDRFFHDFTHGYLTFIVPLLLCGGTYLVMLLTTGMLKKLLKKSTRN